MDFKQKLLQNYNVSSAAMFLGFIILYTIVEDIKFNLFTVLAFILLFWLANSLQARPEKD
ncbi:hypothetical protein [Planococcus glaciei]|uniref:hypothetical protein n=1 Tax=Planococcus glaciei TaxID=459472 RepID=UPI0011131CE2|nr:hypothetical protein [Planococcus glaciei]